MSRSRARSGTTRGHERGLIPATTRRPRAGPATDNSGGDGLVCRGGVGVTFRDSDVPGNVFPGKVTFRENVRKLTWTTDVT